MAVHGSQVINGLNSGGFISTHVSPFRTCFSKEVIFQVVSVLLLKVCVTVILLEDRMLLNTAADTDHTQNHERTMGMDHTCNLKNFNSHVRKTN